MLLVVGDRKPVLDERDARTDQHAFELGAAAEELRYVFLGAETHHTFDAGPIVPGAVEQHDFTLTRQVRHIALEIPLSTLTL